MAAALAAEQSRAVYAQVKASTQPSTPGSTILPNYGDLIQSLQQHNKDFDALVRDMFVRWLRFASGVTPNETTKGELRAAADELAEKGAVSDAHPQVKEAFNDVMREATTASQDEEQVAKLLLRIARSSVDYQCELVTDEMAFRAIKASVSRYRPSRDADDGRAPANVGSSKRFFNPFDD